MNEKNWMLQLESGNQLATITDANSYTAQFGLSLSEEDAKLLLQERKQVLLQERRVEFGAGILPKLIFAFCDSSYLNQDNYAKSLGQLQEIFYRFKNESMDLLTDEELLTFMSEQLEGVCFGDLEYLEGTCLEIFSQAVRAGYRGYESTGGSQEYQQFDPVPRWDKDLYLEVLQELFWG